MNIEVERHDVGRPSLTWGSVAGTFVTPITLSITGMMYLGGHFFRFHLFHSYGLSANGFSEPLQATLASGSVIALGAIIIGGVIIFITVGTVRTFGWTSIYPDSIFEYFLIMGGTIAMFLGLSVSVGVLMADIQIAQNNSLVDAGCRQGCFEYVVDGKKYIGYLIGEDDQRGAIYTPSGVFVFQSEKLAEVREYRHR